jgi:hypothetical protein
MLQRKPPTAKVARLRKRDNEVFATLRRRAARWARDNFQKLTDPDPSIPEVLNDRAADNWRPLFAIADLAGDDWARRAREAACVLSGEGHDDAINVELLADSRKAFGEAEVIRSVDMVNKLAADPERPWAEWNKGKPLTQRQLAKLLKPFGIISQSVSDGTWNAKGYKRTWFEGAWGAYLPGQNTLGAQEPPSDPSKRQSADGMGTSGDFSSVKATSFDGSKNGKLSYSHAGFDALTDKRPGNGATDDFDQAPPRCDHCGQPNPNGHWDWPDRPDGIWLHERCEGPWFDSECGAA